MDTARSIVVVIEYFGYPAWYGPLRESLPGFEGLIFVDCAHSAKIAPYADVALRVFNKLIPVTDGAVIYSRISELDLTVDEDGLLPLPVPAIRAYQNHLNANRAVSETKDGQVAEMGLARSVVIIMIHITRLLTMT